MRRTAAPTRPTVTLPAYAALGYGVITKVPADVGRIVQVPATQPPLPDEPWPGAWGPQS